MLITLNKQGLVMQQISAEEVNVTNESQSIAPIFFYVGLFEQPNWIGFVQALLKGQV